MSKAVKHQPITPLPWVHIPWMITSGDEADDAAYVVHAVNAYPDLVAKLKIFVAKYDAAPDGYLGLGLVNGDFILARELLCELGEE